MNEYDYKNLTPFKWFILENFPFIEESFDAITNYQLFCKLGDEINKLINSENSLGNQVENLTNAFIELQNYVNNYFENLDVQDEINNKLDEMAQSGQLTEIIAQYLSLAGLLCFNTVNEMKNADNLVDGSFAKTLGYYLADDGGGAIYKITSQESQTEHQEQLINNLYANLIVDRDKINVKQFGSINSENINKAIDYAYSNFGGGIIYIPKQDGTIELENYINVKNNCILDMGNNNFEIIENFVNQNGFCIGMNTENGSSWDVAYNRGCEIRNANILNTSSTKKCIVTLSTNTVIENIMFTNFENAISKITYYTDSCKISRCMFFYDLNDTPTDYKIRCEYGGDGLLIEQCHFGVGSRIYTPKYNKAIYLYGCRGGNIVDCINGEYNLFNCMGVSISNCHIEVGKVKFDQSIACTFSNSGFFWLPTYQNEAIVVDYNCEVDLKDLTFYLTSDDYSLPQNDYYDITIRLNSNVHMENITKTYVLSNGEKCITAPKIKEINENNVGYDLNPFNRLSCILYKNYNTGKNIKNLYNVNFSSNDYKVSSLSQGNANFNATSNITYYYNAILYFEEVKKLGYGTHVEQSILNNGNSIILTLSKPSLDKAMIRVYRGTSPNSYDKYVDIPIINGNKLEDNGTTISGYYWKNRTAGNIDDFNECLKVSETRNFSCEMTARPNKGTWEKGNVVYNSNPQYDGHIGWICTQYGTAGTWYSLGKIVTNE